jgi:trigger factor
VRNRLEEAESRQIEGEFREAVLDAVVANATVEVPEALVEARAKELLDQTLHSLSHQGISKEIYLQISGKTEEELLEEAKPDADRALRREAVLIAIVEAEGIEVSDDEVLEALSESAERGGTKPKKLLDRLRSEGRLDSVKEDLAARKAVDLLVESAQATDAEQAARS